MQLFETIDRIQRIHKLIQNESTGTPCEFAERFHIGRRQLYNILEEFKDFGALIQYSRAKNTFFYRNNFELELTIKVSPLKEQEKVYTYGEENENRCASAISLHSSNLSLLI